jgi:hypothetical protein
MLEGVAIGLDALKKNTYLDDAIRIEKIDRYIAYDWDKRLTYRVFQHIIYWIKRYSWDEAYEERDDEDSTYRRLEEYKSSLLEKNLTEQYYQSIYEELYQTARYKSRVKYDMLQHWLSYNTGYPLNCIKAKDLDLRLRKEWFLSPNHSITTPYGRNYLYLRYYDTEKKEYTGCFTNVGDSCIVCLKERELMYCSRCKEACYCSREHQKKDWSRHKSDCLILL